MISIAIVEDDESSANGLRDMILRYEKEKGQTFDMTLYKNGWDFLNQYKRTFDIVFMDIEMPYINGMETAKRLREMDDAVCLIFVTNMMSYAINGYEVGAQDFMLKPVEYFNLSLKLDKAIRGVRKHRTGDIVIPYEDGIMRLLIDDILYVEVVKHNVLYYSDREVYRVRSSMTNAEKSLSGYPFAKCNSCYLVHLKYVDKVADNFVYIGEHKLQISRAKKKEFIDRLTEYLGGRR